MRTSEVDPSNFCPIADALRASHMLLQRVAGQEISVQRQLLAARQALGRPWQSALPEASERRLRVMQIA